MIFLASAPFINQSFSKLSIPLLTSSHLRAQKQPQYQASLRRSLYTHVRETGISTFDKNRKLFESQYQGKRLPSWLENCRFVSQEEVEELYKSFPAFVQDLTGLSCTNNLPLGNQRLRNITEYIVPWAPVMAVQAIAVDRFYFARARRKKNDIANEENHTFLAHKLAWALEMISRQTFVTDDIIDASDKRNGLPCWHTLPNIGLGAINDFSSLVTGGFLVLDRYFHAKDYYAELIKFVFEQLHVTYVGTNEMVATKAAPKLERIHQGIRDSSLSTRKLLAVKSELNARVAGHLPVIGTMIMHRIKDPVLIRQAYEIGYKVFDYCSMVDDYIDCFGSSEVIEREASDIRNGSQSWLIWKAMDLGNPEQCQRLADCYGKNEAKCVEEVKEIYRQLNVKEIVSKMAEDFSKEVEAEIMRLPQDDLPCFVWLNMLNHFRDVALGKAARP